MNENWFSPNAWLLWARTVSGLAHYVKNILIGLKGGSYVVDVGNEKKMIPRS